MAQGRGANGAPPAPPRPVDRRRRPRQLRRAAGRFIGLPCGDDPVKDAEDAQHQHKHGLGWIANTAKVADTVYVGPYALVYGEAELTGKVRVLDLAQVSGHAKLSGDVVVAGFVWLDGNFKADTGYFAKNARVQEKQVRIR